MKYIENSSNTPSLMEDSDNPLFQHCLVLFTIKEIEYDVYIEGNE